MNLRTILNCQTFCHERGANQNEYNSGYSRSFYLSRDLDRSALFLQKNCPFPLKMSDPPPPCKVALRPTFLWVLQAKWQLAIFFFFWPDFFFHHFCPDTRGKITSASVAICCPSSDVWPCLIWFHLFTFITVIPSDSQGWRHRQVWHRFGMAQWKVLSSEPLWRHSKRESHQEFREC